MASIEKIKQVVECLGYSWDNNALRDEGIFVLPIITASETDTLRVVKPYVIVVIPCGGDCLLGVKCLDIPIVVLSHVLLETSSKRAKKEGEYWSEESIRYIHIGDISTDIYCVELSWDFSVEEFKDALDLLISDINEARNATLKAADSMRKIMTLQNERMMEHAEDAAFGFNDDDDTHGVLN